MAKGTDKDEPKADIPGVVNITEYRWALQLLDSEDGVGDIIGDIQNANAGDVDAALSQLGAVLGRLREVIGLRGWKPQAGAIQLAFRANVADWEPKGTLLRIILDVPNPDPESLPTLWGARGKQHDVIIRGGVRQPALGEAPPEWDIGEIIAEHNEGVHRLLPNIGCPMCLAELEAKRQAGGPPEALEGAEPEPEFEPEVEPEPEPSDLPAGDGEGEGGD
ncbi:MAG: hypothetical protein MUO37_05195 [Methyloceanibacter sp.]|nr:hypothetical protein [Methyloceanibacter sp.]